MKVKTIKQIINKKTSAWFDSIKDESVKKLAEQNTIVTGGCIASMLLKESVNDFDVYFKSFAAAKAIADYYVEVFAKNTGHQLSVVVEDDQRIKIGTERGHRGETAADPVTLTDAGEIEDTYEDLQSGAEAVSDDSFRPVFLSTNAITLSNKVQLVLRFYGEPEVIHKNYDFVHCTNYWKSWDKELVLKQEALESILAKELRYMGSKYPVCSVFRLRKFIKRDWTINAGQILKMAMQISDLDLHDPVVLEDQLTGVDCAYFIQLMDSLKANNPERVNSAYLCEILDRMF